MDTSSSLIMGIGKPLGEDFSWIIVGSRTRSFLHHVGHHGELRRASVEAHGTPIRGFGGVPGLGLRSSWRAESAGIRAVCERHPEGGGDLLKTEQSLEGRGGGREDATRTRGGSHHPR